MPPTTDDARCCWIDPAIGYPEGVCTEPAEFMLIDGPHPYDDTTYGCSDHAGHLVTDERESRMIPLALVA